MALPLPPPANVAPAGGKHVVSAVPGQGPRDLSDAVERHRQREAGLTDPPGVPAGGWPQTAGHDPDAPAGIEPSQPWTGDPISSATPSSYSAANSFHPRNPDY
jgi:hypothetical protein